MNSSMVKVSIVVALLSAVVIAPAEAATKATGFPASKITVSSGLTLHSTARTEIIRVGTPRARVLALLGKPAQTITPDLVFFENCRPDQPVAQHCSTLVVTFANDKVSSLRFVNKPAADNIAQNPPTLESWVAMAAE